MQDFNEATPRERVGVVETLISAREAVKSPRRAEEWLRAIADAAVAGHCAKIRCETIRCGDGAIIAQAIEHTTFFSATTRKQLSLDATLGLKEELAAAVSRADAAEEELAATTSRAELAETQLEAATAKFEAVEAAVELANARADSAEAQLESAKAEAASAKAAAAVKPVKPPRSNGSSLPESGKSSRATSDDEDYASAAEEEVDENAAPAAAAAATKAKDDSSNDLAARLAAAETELVGMRSKLEKSESSRLEEQSRHKKAITALEAEREALGAEVQQLSERLEQEAVSSPKRRAKEAEEQLDELKAASDEAAMRAEAAEEALGAAKDEVTALRDAEEASSEGSRPRYGS